MRSKSETRFNKQVQKNHMKDIVKNVWKKPELASDPAFIGKLESVHGKDCSGPTCRNPRTDKSLNKNKKLTKSEKISLEKLKEDIKD